MLRVATYTVMVYAPHYAADALGLWRKHGVQVQLRHLPGLVGMTSMIRGGEADACVANLSYACRTGGPGPSLTPVAWINEQVYAVLIARYPDNRFSWSDLAGRTVIYPGDLTTFCALRQALAVAGVDAGAANLLPALRAPDVVDQWTSGLGDFAVVPIEQALRLKTPWVATIADQVGRITWSVCLAPPQTLANHAEELTSFRNALTEAKQWVREHRGLEVAPVIRRYFPADHEPWLAASVDAYNEIGMWQGTAEIDREPARRWLDILIRYGAAPSDLSLDEVL